ncbi:replication protein [Xenorhabdus koppenhoeferi]|uniref:Phage replication protein O n=1 Tax=Xenorhabdus koppenhoeferi TaxID=351659 RepID=A0A1I7K8G1_9GAMM|nr:replication protein [Xenorhabdus koppenhoeferi]SFU93724.1 phage replication protein O [Xenorhabdus koppenhoeferi]
MNTAEVYQFPVRQEIHKVADVDNGFTRLANELLEAVMLAGLSQHQLLVFLAISRKTYGFNKSLDWVSNEQLSKLTGILPHKCSAAKSELVKRNILITNGRQVGINKNISEWEDKNKVYPNQVNLPESGKKSLPKSGKSDYPNQVNTKDNITKEKKDNNTPISPSPKKASKPKFDINQVSLPEWLDPAVWEEWLEYRSAIKKPIKTPQTAKGQIKLLNECYDAGYSPSEVIAASITNGWQGLFRPKYPSKAQPVNRITQPIRSEQFISEDF